MEELKALSENLLALRKKAGKTQQEVAAKVGMTAAALSAYETGKKQPKLDYAVRLARYYGVTLDRLCGNESENSEEITAGEKFLYYLTKLCEEDESIPIEIEVHELPFDEYPKFYENYKMSYCVFDSDKFVENKIAKIKYITLKIFSPQAANFSIPYKKYLELYRSGAIEADLFRLWKKQRIKQLSEPLYLSDDGEE